MKKLVLIAALTLVGCATPPPSNLHGTFQQYREAKNIHVEYVDVQEARKDCERLGFAVIEDYSRGGFLVVRVPYDLKMEKLVELAKCASVKYITPTRRQTEHRSYSY